MLETPFGTSPLWSRFAAVALAASLACAAPALAQQDAAEPPPPVAEVHEGPPEAVIAPGQEELLASMLGKGGGLQGCSLTNGNIQHKVLEATYTCPGGDVVVELTHPSEAGSGATKTDKFAVRVKSGTPPDGFVDALAARIHAQEGPFKWTMLGGSGTSSQTTTLVIVLVALMALAVVAWLIRSRSRRPAPH